MAVNRTTKRAKLRGLRIPTTVYLLPEEWDRINKARLATATEDLPAMEWSEFYRELALGHCELMEAQDAKR